MGPINYQADVQSPFASAIQGYQVGAGIKQNIDQQAALQQQQQAQMQQQQILQGLLMNKNAGADDYAQAMVVMPQLREPLAKAWEVKSKAQSESHMSDLSQWSAALRAGRPDIVVDRMNKRADLIEQNNNGAPTPESQAMRANAGVVEQDPNFGRVLIDSMIFAGPGGKDVIDSIAKLGAERRSDELQPGLVKKGAADASKAEVDAKYAEPTILKDLEVKGWNIENIKSEIGFRKESNRIAAMNAAANRESNDLKRQELKLKIQETTSAMEQKARDKVAEVETAHSTIDNMLNTIDRLKQNKALDDVVGSIEGQKLYPNQAAAVMNLLNPFASSGDDRADAIAMIETIGSQAFLAQVPAMRGMGSLTEREGAKLESSLQNLSRAQSEKQFRANLDEAQRLMLKLRTNISNKYGVKQSVPDTPQVSTSGSDIDALVKKYSGG